MRVTKIQKQNEKQSKSLPGSETLEFYLYSHLMLIISQIPTVVVTPGVFAVVIILVTGTVLLFPFT